MPNLATKARAGRLAAIAQLSSRRIRSRSYDADRLFMIATSMIETGKQPAPKNIFAV